MTVAVAQKDLSFSDAASVTHGIDAEPRVVSCR